MLTEHFHPVVWKKHWDFHGLLQRSTHFGYCGHQLWLRNHYISKKAPYHIPLDVSWRIPASS